MKLFSNIVLLGLLIACGNSKKMKEKTDPAITTPTELSMIINDIWVAETIYGERFEPNGNKIPQLEVHVKENQFMGNDGCNRFSGPIKSLDNSNLVFGLSMGTKMACENMNLPKQFNKAIAETRTYKIEKLRLYLLDENSQEVMVLKKVD